MIEGAPRSSTATLLAELPEAQASGEQLRIYGEIRRLSAVPMVALIYRHLATIPGALEWAWALVEPALRSGRLQERAWQLASQAAIPGQRTIPRAALRAAGIDAVAETTIAQVLQAYNRANPVNMLVVGCLAQHLGGKVEPRPGGLAASGWQPPPAPAPLPPMVDPAAMPAAVRELALLLTDRVDGRPPSPLWPSLYRHLAHWPAILGYASVLVPPEFAAIDAAAGQLRREVQMAAVELARDLPLPAALAAPDAAQGAVLQSAIERFSVRIPEMVVIGGLLQRALPAHLPSSGALQ